MKSSKIIFCLFFGLFFHSQHSYSETFLGLKFGIVQSNLTLGYSGLQKYTPLYRSGFGASLSLRKYVSKNFSLEFDAQYLAMGSKIQNIFIGSRPEDLLELRYNYFSIPVSLYYDVMQRDKIRINLHSGIAPAVFFSGSVKDDVETSELAPGEDLEYLDLFWQSGIGIQFLPIEKMALHADFNFVKGLLNVNMDSDDSQKNKAFVFQVGISKKF